MNTPVSGTPRLLLRLEAVSVLVAAVIGYRELGASWWLFVAALLVPDLSIAAYAAGSRVGAGIYNAFHSYLAPGLVAALAYLSSSRILGVVCLIWTVHIAMDRALGYGLKFSSAFRDTHLGTLGGKSRTA